MTKNLKSIAERWMIEGWQKGNVQMVDELHAPDFVDHAAAGRDSSREGFKAGIAGLYAAFPDFYAVTEDLIIDATTGKVVIRWTAAGTQCGTFVNIPPTGKKITFAGIEIIRIENDRIVERWGEWNGLDLIEQLGGLP